VKIIRKIKLIYQQDGLSSVLQRLWNRIVSSKTVPAWVDIQSEQVFDRHDYSEWVRRYDTLSDDDRAGLNQRLALMNHTPVVSVILNASECEPKWLLESVHSVRSQVYPHWQLHILYSSAKPDIVLDNLNPYVKEDSQITLLSQDPADDVCSTINNLLDLHSGEWVLFLHGGDLLPEQALFRVAEAINRHPGTRLFYTDEDRVDGSGNRSDPYFKCDWNAALFTSQNLIGRTGVYNSDVLRETGGFRDGFAGAYEYDLALRYIERIDAEQIQHIPRVLYHLRGDDENIFQSQMLADARLAGAKALNEHFQRLGIDAVAEFSAPGYRVRYALPESPPLVSLIIPSRNKVELVQACVETILAKTTYSNYEILIVDNGSDDPDTLAYFEAVSSESRVRVLRDDRPFNYSALNNAAVDEARGEVIGLINSDITVISSEWLSEMVSYAVQADVGVVGARLWYPDDTLQHGGIILGIYGSAGHSHKRFARGKHGYFGRMALVSEFSAVTGACLLVRKNIYQELGGLNEIDLPVAYNDVDLCLRVRAAGYRNIWTPYAELYHHESASRGYEDTAEKQVRLARDIEYLQKQWGELLANDPAYSPNLTLEHEDFGLAWPPRVGE